MIVIYFITVCYELYILILYVREYFQAYFTRYFMERQEVSRRLELVIDIDGG